MKEIAFLGEYEVVTGFKPFGVNVFPVTDGDQVREIFAKIITEGYKIIFISETILEFIEKEVEEYFIKPFPIITIVPGIQTPEKMAEEEEEKDKVIEIIEKTIGTHLLKENR